LDAAYLDRWGSDTLLQVMAIRTSLMAGMQDYLIQCGLLNLERVQLSRFTDPLAHEVEHTPTDRANRGCDLVQEEPRLPPLALVLSGW
jgi:hypothetical protein